MNDELVRIEDLTVRFATRERVVHAVNGVSLALAERETLGILTRQSGLGAIPGADVATQQAALAQLGDVRRHAGVEEGAERGGIRLGPAIGEPVGQRDRDPRRRLARPGADLLEGDHAHSAGHHYARDDLRVSLRRR